MILDLEHVGEVGSDGDFQVEADVLAPVIDDIEVLMQSAAQRAADDEPQSSAAAPHHPRWESFG